MAATKGSAAIAAAAAMAAAAAAMAAAAVAATAMCPLPHGEGPAAAADVGELLLMGVCDVGHAGHQCHCFCAVCVACLFECLCLCRHMEVGAMAQQMEVEGG